jgi:hypothetical protein
LTQQAIWWKRQGLALVVWVTIVMLDLKHLNTSGFTLP